MFYLCFIRYLVLLKISFSYLTFQVLVSNFLIGLEGFLVLSVNMFLILFLVF